MQTTNINPQETIPKLPNGNPISRTLQLCKKLSAKNYKPNCDSSKYIAENWTRSKTLSEEDLIMLRAAGYTLRIETIDQFSKKNKSAINLPHVQVYYNKSSRTWEGNWLNLKTGSPLADLIQKPTKKRVLEALLSQEIDIRNKDL